MAISKRNSRVITIDGTKYRYTVFGNSGWNDLTVQAASGTGQKLCVQFPPIEQTKAGPINVITPSTTADAINFALKNGWTPTENGKPFNARFQSASFIVRN